MKVVMINSAYDGCGYVRIMLPAFHNGFLTDKGVYMTERLDPRSTGLMLEQADVVVFHRPEDLEFHHLAKMLKKNGKKIVMDNDDTFRISDYHPLAGFQPNGEYAVELGRRVKSIDDFMRLADLVTTSTDFLANEYSKIVPRDKIVVLPNCVDRIDWDEPLRNDTDVVRVGMVGSVSYEYDYLHLKPLIRELSKKRNIRFILFGLGDAKHREDNPRVTKAFKDEYEFWDSIDKEQISWCPVHEYPDKLNEARLDIMLIPRRDNYFNRCKSNVKFLEASMCEIPCIMQSFDDGPYEEVKGKEVGVLVRDNDKWGREIHRLISSKKLRRTIGKNANKYTLKNYSIEDHAAKWEEAYSSLF